MQYLEAQSTPISVSATLPTGDAGNATITTYGVWDVIMSVSAVNGLTGTIEGLPYDDTTLDWHQTECWQYDSATHTMTRRAPGTTITLVDEDELLIPGDGYRKIRFKRAAGTSATITVNTCPDVWKRLASQQGISLTAVVPGTGATNLGKAEDGAATSGDTGVMGLVVYNTTPAQSAGTVGDYSWLQNDSEGKLWARAHGSKTRVQTEKTRPADTTVYTAKDAISESTSAGTAWTFTSVARVSGGSGYIVAAGILTDQTTNTETFRLHLFNAAPTGINDNAACTAPLYASASSYIGTINFPACKTEGSGATSAYANITPNTVSSDLPLAFKCNADANLYGLLETPTGFTPASGQKITITLQAECD